MPVEPTDPGLQQRARGANKKLEMLAARRMQVRAGLSLVSSLLAVVTGVLAAAVPAGLVYYLLFAFAGSLLFLIFGVLLLDAHGHWREIRGRNWTSVTPRFARDKPTPTGAGEPAVPLPPHPRVDA